ncbi:MAG: hypothetical protein QXN56_01345 [Candidatus Hadarchaeum sp.]
MLSPVPSTYYGSGWGGTHGRLPEYYRFEPDPSQIFKNFADPRRFMADLTRDVSPYAQGLTAPVPWERVDFNQLQNPMQVIEGARPLIEQQRQAQMAAAAAKFGAAGMGLSSPYQERLGRIGQQAAAQLADITNKYLFEAAKERQGAELQAALANQQAGLEAERIRRQGLQSLADIVSRGRMQAYGAGSGFAERVYSGELERQMQQLNYLYQMMLGAR